MVIALSGRVRTDPAGRKTIVIARAVNAVLSGLGLPLSRYTFGEAEVTRQSLIDSSVSRALRSAERQGATYPYRVKPEHFALNVQGTTEFLNSVSVYRKYGYSYTEAEIAAALVAAGYAPSADYEVGLWTDYLHESINYALSTVRVVVTPTGDPWRVSATMFERMVDLVFQKLRELDPDYAASLTRTRIAGYIIQRGYMPSAGPPVYTQPALPITTPAVLVSPVVPPVPTVIVSPVPYTPPIRTVVIEPPYPDWTPPPLPEYSPTEIVVRDQIEEATRAGDNKNLILWIVGAAIGGLVLSDMMKTRGGRYA